MTENPGESIPGRVIISPHGTLFAFPFDEYITPATKLAIVPITGGPPLKSIKVLAEIHGLRWAQNGKGKGDLRGIAPTGKQITISGVSIARLANGKIVEGWVNWDALGFMQQLGVSEIGV